MASIVKATETDVQLLTGMGKITFIESHGTSAAPEEINQYVNEKYTPEVITREVTDPKNIYHIIYHDKQPAGFSKIIFNVPYKDISQQNVTKLERIYLLKEFYGLQLGNELFHFNLSLSKNEHQAGMWLYVWKENHRAFAFYEKLGFKIIGDGDFRLTPTHANPNYIMFLQY